MKVHRVSLACRVMAPLILIVAAHAHGQDVDFQLGASQVESSSWEDCLDCEEAEELECSYGPCDCQPRKTLMQWSYGTSFGGGPDLDEPLVSDRPDFTEASNTVGRGVRQIEMGYTYSFDDEGDDTVRGHSYPQLLLRVGVLAEWLELRFEWNAADVKQRVAGGPETTTAGSADIRLGMKLALTPQENLLPETAIIVQMAVPTGSDELSADEVLAGVNFLYSWEVNDFLSIGGSTQANRAADDAGGFYTEFAQSATVGYSLTDRLGAYTEWFVLSPTGAQTAQTEHVFNGGFTYLVTNDFQLDILGGLGLNAAAADYFIGSGAVVRF